MNRADEVFAVFVDANPVADVAVLAEAARPPLGHFLEEREGSIDVQTQDRPVRLEPPPGPPVKRNWLAPALTGVAAAMVAIVVAVIMLAGGDEGPDAITPGPEVTPFSGETLAGGGVLTVLATDEEWLPFVTQEGSGFDVEVMTEMARRAGLTVTFDRRPLTGVDRDDVLALVGESADVYVGALVVTPERSQLAAFTSPYYRNRLAVVVNPALTPNVSGIDDLGDGDIVAVWAPRSPTEQWVRDRLTGTEVAFVHMRDALGALEFGGVTAYIQDQAHVEAILAEHPGLEIVEQLDVGQEFAFPVDADNPELAAALDGALQGMIDDGTYQEIYDRWFGSPDGSVAG